MEKENTTRIAEFLDADNKTDMYAIYQLKQEDRFHYYLFTPLDLLRQEGNSVKRDNYNTIYAAPLERENVNSIYEKFNIKHPSDFRGHSLSVSDIVVLKQNGKYLACYVDPYCFRVLPDFMEQKYELNYEPVVTVTSSEHPQFPDTHRIPISKANDLFGDLDNEQHYGRLKDDHKGAWYYKTHFQIAYIQNGEINHYSGRQDFGDGDGSLIAHIRATAEHRLTYEYQKHFMENDVEGRLEQHNHYWDHVLNNFIPYLILHCEFAELDNFADTNLAVLQNNEQPSQAVNRKIDFYTAVKKYVADCRQSLNFDTKVSFAPFPDIKDCELKETETARLNDYKTNISRLPRPITEQQADEPSGKKSDMEM